MKKVIIFLVLSFLIFLAGWYLKKPEVIIREIKPNIEENQEKIKQLEGEIIEYQKEIDSLHNVREKVKIIIKEKISEVQTLPADSSVALLRENLEVPPEDSLPSLQEDSTVLISQENVRDINVMYVKYDGLQKENEILGEQIEMEDSIICLKDSIIIEKDTIIDKTVTTYEGELKKEKKKRRLWTGISGGLAVIIGLILVL